MLSPGLGQQVCRVCVCARAHAKVRVFLLISLCFLLSAGFEGSSGGGGMDGGGGVRNDLFGAPSEVPTMPSAQTNAGPKSRRDQVRHTHDMMRHEHTACTGTADTYALLQTPSFIPFSLLS